MPHVLLWLLVLGSPAQPMQVLITSAPFPTLEACEAWDKVQLSMRSTVVITNSVSKCVPAEQAPHAPAPQGERKL